LIRACSVWNQDRLRIHNFHSNIIMTNLLKNREFRADDWKWDTRELSFIISQDYTNDVMRQNWHISIVQLPSFVAVWLASDEVAFLTDRSSEPAKT
jgi:hypothetical protein